MDDVNTEYTLLDQHMEFLTNFEDIFEQDIFEGLEDYQLDVFQVGKEGFLLPHVYSVQEIYIKTTRTRAHLANPEKTEYIVGELSSRPIESLYTINDDLWRKGSNLTLAVFNAFCSLLTRATRPVHFLFDAARSINKTPYYGVDPKRIYCAATVTIQDELGRNNTYSGTMPSGMYLVLMITHTMATTQTNNSSIWGSTREFADRQIIQHLHKKARDTMRGIKFELCHSEVTNRFSIETLVLLSKRVENIIQVMAELVQTPEPIPSNTKTAQKCPSCSKRISTATPRYKLQKDDEEYQEDNDDLVGEMCLLKIPIKIGTVQTSRHIYICSNCNDDERPLRFCHLSKNPVKRKRDQDGCQLSNKRRGSNRIQNTIERNLDVIDFLSESFLSDSEKTQVRRRAESLRNKLV